MDNILCPLIGQKGRPIFLFKEHLFSEDDRATKKPRKVKIYRCSSRRSGCLVKLYEDDRGIRMEGIHTCKMKLDALENSELRVSIGEAIKKDKNARKITQNLTKQYDFITDKAIRYRVQRAVPPPCMPHSSAEMLQMISEAENGAPTFKGSLAEEEGDKLALFFATTEMMSVLNDTSRLIINKVEKVLPLPTDNEVWIIHAETRGKPLHTSVYCAMLIYIAHPSKAFRKSTFACLMKLVPELKRVQSVLTTEKILCEDVLSDCFPVDMVWISWLSYVEELCDLWARCGLKDTPLSALHQCWKLGLSREFHVQEGLKFVEEEVQKNTGNYPNLGEFYFSFKNQWLGRLDKLISPREALHLEKRPEALSRLIAGSLKQCNTIEKFLGAINKMLNTELELRQAFLNGAVKKDKRDKTIPIITIADSTKLSNAQLQLHHKQITLQKFFSRCLRPKLIVHLDNMILKKAFRESTIDHLEKENVQPGSSGLRGEQEEITGGKKNKLNFLKLKATICQEGEPLNHDENFNAEKPDLPLLHQLVDIATEFSNDVPNVQLVHELDLENYIWSCEDIGGMTEEDLLKFSGDTAPTTEPTEQQIADWLLYH